MEIKIDGITCEYTSDYPKGWNKKFNDYFKFPVWVCGKEVFIKRFQQAPLAVRMLVDLKDGASAVGIPDIYAFRHSEEEEALYLFQEYVLGSDLDDKMKGIATFDLSHYASQMFQAFRFLSDHDFWHTDFTEENILVDPKKNFYLIDIDSCRSMEEEANSNHIKDASFSGSIFQNLKRINPNFAFGDIDGAQLNILQLIFSVIHFYNFTRNRQNHIYADFLKSNTAHQLNTLIPFIDEILLKSLREPISFADLQRILDFIKSEGYGTAILTNQPSDSKRAVEAKAESISIIKPESAGTEEPELRPLAPLTVAPANSTLTELEVPLIQSLEVDGRKRDLVSFKEGEEYMLSWTVLNASYVELDGEVIPTTTRMKRLKAEQTRTHELIAINKNEEGEKRSEGNTIQVRVERLVNNLVPPKLIHFKVDGNSSNFRVPLNYKVTVSWHVENVTSVTVNNLENRPRGKFTKVMTKPYTFVLEVANIKRKINVAIQEPKPIIPPVIDSFTVNASSQEYQTLSANDPIAVAWETQYANNIQLYKNNDSIPLSKTDREKGTYSLVETNPTKVLKPIELKLVVISKDGQQVESFRQVWLQPQRDNKTVVALVVSLVVIAILLTLLLTLKF